MNIEDFIQSANKFNADTRSENSRYRSWEYCYAEFVMARKQSLPDYDYLSLHLAFYLASWGMLRASFLLQKDYKVHIPAVQIILKPEYDCLQNLKCQDVLKQEVQTAWQKVNDELSDYYGKVRETVKDDVKSKPSSVLMSKILLGTLACTPAYDRFFMDTAKVWGVTANYGMRSLKELAKLYAENETELENLRQTLHKEQFEYPQMKLLDMGFWQFGFENSANKDGQDDE